MRLIEEDTQGSEDTARYLPGYLYGIADKTIEGDRAFCSGLNFYQHNNVFFFLSARPAVLMVYIQ